MAWNLTGLQGNDTTFLNLVVVVNDAVNGILVGGLILGLFIIQAVMLSTKTPSVTGAGTLSAWLCFIYSIFFSMAGLLNFYFVIGFLILAGFGVLYMYLEGK